MSDNNAVDANQVDISFIKYNMSMLICFTLHIITLYKLKPKKYNFSINLSCIGNEQKVKTNSSSNATNNFSCTMHIYGSYWTFTTETWGTLGRPYLTHFKSFSFSFLVFCKSCKFSTSQVLIFENVPGPDGIWLGLNQYPLFCFITIQVSKKRLSLQVLFYKIL